MRASIDPLNLHRFLYHLRHYSQLCIPDAAYRRCLNKRVQVDPALQAEVVDRVAYYHPWDQPFQLEPDCAPFRCHWFGKRTSYRFDLHEVLRYFDPRHRVAYQFGDITEVPPRPTVVKSRPIQADHRASIILNLNQARHFYFVRDRRRFQEKKDQLVWRGRARVHDRQVFLRQFYSHPLCDVGHFHKQHSDVIWTKPHLSVHQQLQYKFILSLEGNDVASNLKWILSSNSLCFMRRPRFETWFMEGRLEAGRHYVEIRADFADIEEKIEYYKTHAEAAQTMIAEAQAWVARFQHPRIERAIALLVMWHYFYLSGQCPEPPPLGHRENAASKSA